MNFEALNRLSFRSSLLIITRLFREKSWCSCSGKAAHHLNIERRLSFQSYLLRTYGDPWPTRGTRGFRIRGTKEKWKHTVSSYTRRRSENDHKPGAKGHFVGRNREWETWLRAAFSSYPSDWDIDGEKRERQEERRVEFGGSSCRMDPLLRLSLSCQSFQRFIS